MRRASISLIFAVIALFSLACENSFTPKGPYQDKMVVYAVLSAENDTQYVRLYTTYNPSGFDPYANTAENDVSGAVITVSQASSATGFRDTVVARYDKSRYTNDIGAYVAYPFRAIPGTSYNLNVVSPTYGTITASLSVPDRGRLYVNNRYVLKGGGDKNEDLAVFVWIRYATRGYLVRYYLNYDVLHAGVWVNHQAEVPSGVLVIDNNTRIYSYPRLQRRTTTPASVIKEEQEVVYFSRTAYELKQYDLGVQYKPESIRFNGAWFVLTQVEANLYNYYNVSNAFQDQHSIRTDVPNWTNINGGYGVFGAQVSDSTYIDFSASF
jgi:hypothetical protein